MLAVVVRYFDEKTCEVVDALLDSLEVSCAIMCSYSTEQYTWVCQWCGQWISSPGKAWRTLGFHFWIHLPFFCIVHKPCKQPPPIMTLPSWPETFLNNLCCYFTGSSKRQHAFRSIQEVVSLPQHKMLKVSQSVGCLRKCFSKNHWTVECFAAIFFFKSKPPLTRLMKLARYMTQWWLWERNTCCYSSNMFLARWMLWM